MAAIGPDPELARVPEDEWPDPAWVNPPFRPAPIEAEVKRLRSPGGPILPALSRLTEDQRRPVEALIGLIPEHPGAAQAIDTLVVAVGRRKESLANCAAINLAEALFDRRPSD